MITLQDCIAFSGLDTDVIEAVGAHHHLPDIIAAQFAAAQMQTPSGAAAIAQIIQRRMTNPRAALEQIARTSGQLTNLREQAAAGADAVTPINLRSMTPRRTRKAA